MTVTDVAVGTYTMTVESARDEMVLQGQLNKAHNSLHQLRLIAGLCNSGEFDAATNNLPVHERKINGDATDQAILRFSESLGPVSELQIMWKKTFELAFNSKNKYMIRTFSLADKSALNFSLSAIEASDFNAGDMQVTILLSVFGLH
jgi:sodium/potassium-transporting ATPase subunit alpha